MSFVSSYCGFMFFSEVSVRLFIACFVYLSAYNFVKSSSLKRIKAQALELGLVGAIIGQYVMDQQTFEQEQPLERAEKNMKEERKRERGERKHEEQERVRQFELAKVQAEEKIQLAQSAASSKPPSHVSEAVCVDRPRLPAYKDGEDLPSYPTRFERIAELRKIDQQAYAVRRWLTGQHAGPTPGVQR